MFVWRVVGGSCDGVWNRGCRPGVQTMSSSSVGLLGKLGVSSDDILCRGGAYWDCRLSRWGDKIVGCEKFCGLLGGLKWKREVYSDCSFELRRPRHQEEAPKTLAGILGEDSLWGTLAAGALSPKAVREMKLKVLEKAIGPEEARRRHYEFRQPLPPPDSRKVCCYSPKEQCIDIDSPNVAISATPVMLALQTGAVRDVRKRRCGRSLATFL